MVRSHPYLPRSFLGWQPSWGQKEQPGGEGGGEEPSDRGSSSRDWAPCTVPDARCLEVPSGFNLTATSKIGPCVSPLLFLNRLPQIKWLKTTQIYSLRVLELEAPVSLGSSQVKAGRFLLETLGQTPCPGLLQPLEGAINPWLVAPPCVTPSSCFQLRILLLTLTLCLPL